MRSTRGVPKRGPILLLNEQSQFLLGDIFEDANLLGDSTPVCRRVVLWGNDAEVKTFPHQSVAVSESLLAGRLWDLVGDENPAPTGSQAAWQIRLASTAALEQEHFGTRIARSVPVEMREVNSDTCYVESLENGWLFLMPSGAQSGTLLAVGGAPDEVLKNSRLIARQIGGIAETGVEFAAYPRVAAQLCGSGWLACGSAAMSFDPLCGEGAGHAAREAILAAAVICSAEQGAESADLQEHYSRQLLAGFLRHLALCRAFYVSARRGEWWDREIAALDEGIEWTRARIGEFRPPRFRLSGFELQSLY